MGETLSHKHAAQWTDKGTYKETTQSDKARVPRLEIDDANTYIDKDGSNNMTFTDAVTSTKTLAELSTGSSVFGEIVLTPKASSSSTTEGTMFYDSDDNSIWVATE